MNAHQTVPLLLAHVEDHPLAQDAVRADEDVEVAVGVDRGRDGALGGLHVGDVASERDRFAAGGGDFVDDRLHFRGLHAGAPLDVEAGVADDHFRALLGEHFADLRAHAAGPAGDQRDLAL